MLGRRLDEEIREQPGALARLLAEGRDDVARAAERIRAAGPAWAVIAARGSSDNAARYAQMLWGAHNGLSVALAAPSLHTIYGTAPRTAGALVVGISVSGQSPDVVAVVADARRQGATTLAITDDPESPLARAAELTIALACGEEESVAATKSYTNQLLAVAMLSAALDDDGARRDALAAVPDLAADVLRAVIDEELAGAAERGARWFVLGRGFNHGTAHEIALKMKETSYVLAEPASIADLLHGPVAVVEPGFPVVLVAPSGKAAADLDPFLARLEARGAWIVAISDLDGLLERAAVALPLPEAPEWLSPIPAAIAGQRFARVFALARGQDPDRPRGLTKVTRTR